MAIIRSMTRGAALSQGHRRLTPPAHRHRFRHPGGRTSTGLLKNFMQMQKVMKGMGKGKAGCAAWCSRWPAACLRAALSGVPPKHFFPQAFSV